MIYLPISLLRPNMVLARSVSVDPTALPLVMCGQKLSPFIIKKLYSLEIPGVYIESKLGEGLEVEELIDPKIKQKMAVEVKGLYQGYLNQMPVTRSTFDKMSVLIEELLEDVLSKKECLMNVMEIKGYDNYTYFHSIYVGTLVALIGMQLKYTHSQLVSLTMAGILHDIGKVDLPHELIAKPGPLTDDEVALVRKHPLTAVQRLESNRTMSQIVLRGIESHHEKFDGTGYPFGLKGNDIPEMGRILALADVYDALTSHRTYRPAWQPNEAVEYILGCSGSHFDPVILKSFLKTITAYPTGTIIKLSNGEIGLVLSSSADNILRPTLQLISPQGEKGSKVDLLTDRNYLNVTVEGILKNGEELPFGLIL